MEQDNISLDNSADDNDTYSSNSSLMDVDDDNDFDSVSSNEDFSSKSEDEEEDDEESDSLSSSSVESSSENSAIKINYSRNYVFSQKYAETFNKLCMKYGKILQRQSDRRTHFSTSYISV